MRTLPVVVSMLFAVVGCGGSMPTGGNGGNANVGNPGGGDTGGGGSGGGGGGDVGGADMGGAGGGGGGDGSDGGMTPAPVNGTATITGTINGYTVASAKSVVAVVSGTSFNLYIADRADLCAILQRGASPKTTTFLQLGATAGTGPHTFPAGAYTYPSGAGSGGGTGGGMGGGTGGGGTGSGMGQRSALIAQSDANCHLSGYNQASTGNFTIKAPVDTNAKSVDGTFDVTFDVVTQKGTFTGTFSAPVCPNAKDIPVNPVGCE